MRVENLNLKNGTKEDGTNSGGVEQYYEEKGYSGSAKGELSTALGYNTSATGTWSHAEGGACEAGANYAHAEGVESLASGSASHAQNQSCKALGQATHAGGAHSEAVSYASTAHGFHVQTNDSYQTVVGMNNEPGSQGEKRALFVVGNGEYNENTKELGRKSNAFAVYRDGHAEIQNINDEVVMVDGIQQPNNNVVNVDWVRRELNNLINDTIQILPVSDFPQKATAQIVILYE